MTLKKDELAEIRKVLDMAPSIEPVDSKIFFDGHQYNVRIPVRIAKTASVDPQKDRLRFTIEMPKDYREKPSLCAELIRDEK